MTHRWKGETEDRGDQLITNAGENNLVVHHLSFTLTVTFRTSLLIHNPKMVASLLIHSELYSPKATRRRLVSSPAA
jgi:hypothetical protein